MTEWLTANKLVLNLNKTNIMKFITKNSPHCALRIDYRGKCIEETINTKFRGLQSDNHLTWKNPIDQMVPKLSGACYFSYFHSIIKYGIIFWGNSSNSKKIIRIMVGAHPSTPCRSLLKKN
jgi:hypothetical protein